MKTRVISAFAGLALLAAIMALPVQVFGVAVFLLSLVGLNEYYGAMKKAGSNPVNIAGYLSCLPLLYIAWLGEEPKAFFMKLAVFLVMVVLLLLTIFLNDKYKITDVAVTALGILYITYLFSFMIATRTMENGQYYIWFVFIGAWVTDSAAYFIGVAFGKTKILPQISPKKSLQGTIGGIAGCALGMLVYGVILNKFVVEIPIYHLLILGLLCGMISQVGDWTASAIKRYAGIKDFGRIMPGHGGVMDRCDSILFTAPVIYFYISLFF